MVSQARTVDARQTSPGAARRKLTIGQLTATVTDLTGARCTSAMIYHYERKGLINEPARTEAGYRLFSLKDVKRVVCIKRWQREGLSLEEIACRLENGDAATESISLHLALPDDRRTQILNAAIKIFPQKGYEAATLLDIAEEADVSSAAIYQYFDSKEDLFMATIEGFSFRDFLAEVADMLQEEEIATIDDVHHMLERVGKFVLRAHAEKPDIHRMFLAESRSFPEIGKQYFSRLIAPLEELLEQYIFDPHKYSLFRDIDPGLAARSFHGMLVNLLVTQLLIRDEDTSLAWGERQIEQMVDIYLDGVLR